MASLNKVMLIGNLTREPEIRYTAKGTACGDVSLAINRKYTTDDGERKEETTFVDVQLWGKLAELAGQYLHKGNSVLFEGRLQLDEWEDKTTRQKRQKLKVVAESMQFLGGKQGGEKESQGNRPAPAPRSQPQGDRQAPQRQQQPQHDDRFDDGSEGDDQEIPF